MGGWTAGKGVRGLCLWLKNFSLRMYTCQSCNDLVKGVFLCACSAIISYPQHTRGPKNTLGERIGP